ncbi:hypothetical protein LQW54_011642 [Pestalotiopsis sp. IQ-011]
MSASKEIAFNLQTPPPSQEFEVVASREDLNRLRMRMVFGLESKDGCPSLVIVAMDEALTRMPAAGEYQDILTVTKGAKGFDFS